MTGNDGRLSPDDAATVLGLTVEELLELASEGRVPGSVLDGFGWRFSRRGLETFLARRRPPEAAA